MRTIPGVIAGGANALAVDYLRPYPAYSDIAYYNFDAVADYNPLQVEVKRRFTKRITFSAAYTLSKTKTTVSDDGTFTNIGDAAHFDYGPATFDRTHYFVGTFVWDLPKGSSLLGGNKVAKQIFDNWTLAGNTSIATGNPTELTLSISGQDAGNRLLGTYSAANLSGQSARFVLNGSPQSGGTINMAAFTVPGIGQIGPYPRFYLRNPGIYNQDVSVFKNLPLGGDGKRYLQFRMEALNILNHPQFSGYNLATNVVNGAGQAGNTIFSSFSTLAVTNNVRPTAPRCWERTSVNITAPGINGSFNWRSSFIFDARSRAGVGTNVVFRMLGECRLQSIAAISLAADTNSLNAQDGKQIPCGRRDEDFIGCLQIVQHQHFFIHSNSRNPHFTQQQVPRDSRQASGIERWCPNVAALDDKNIRRGTFAYFAALIQQHHFVEPAFVGFFMECEIHSPGCKLHAGKARTGVPPLRNHAQSYAAAPVI